MPVVENCFFECLSSSLRVKAKLGESDSVEAGRCDLLGCVGIVSNDYGRQICSVHELLLC